MDTFTPSIRKQCMYYKFKDKMSLTVRSQLNYLQNKMCDTKKLWLHISPYNFNKLLTFLIVYLLTWLNEIKWKNHNFNYVLKLWYEITDFRPFLFVRFFSPHWFCLYQNHKLDPLLHSCHRPPAQIEFPYALFSKMKN